MANPQTEYGYTRIANEILEEIMKLNLNGTQFRLVMAIWRYTYGFQRKEHEMSLSFLADAINASRGQVTRELNTLIDRKIIFADGVGKGGSRKLGFNKNHTKWDRGTLNRVYPNQSTEVYSNPSTEVYSNQSTKKENTKENIKDTRQSKKYDEDNTYFKMAKYFYDKVEVVANEAGVSHLIKKSNLQTWADDMRKLIELDGVDKHLAKDVMDWVTQDSFWRTNVLSAKKLREKFTELAIKMNAVKQPAQPQYDPRDKEIAFQQWVQGGNNPDDFDWSQ